MHYGYFEDSKAKNFGVEFFYNPNIKSLEEKRKGFWLNG
jgi:hypothetical protein